ncbi:MULTISPECIES: hypothetical protein [unclassified Bradyrhizobium]|uniref:hypothetical protein n=1 Tax=unclassified Bradyrhizobium TaxID=2631580 RepID=UPI002916953D|nr:MULTISPECIES: hypothetical protein [unclassified Bradyrhizobium]
MTHPLFRIVRHPNCLLNILPELVIGLIIYAMPLVLRIRQEETVMREQSATY